jgi:hypothetical protein
MSTISRGPDGYAVASWDLSGFGHDVGVMILDEAGVAVAGPTWLPEPAEQLDIAYSASVGQWFVAYGRYNPEFTDGTIFLAPIDDHALMTVDPIQVSVSSGTLGPRVVPLPRSRLGLGWFREGSVLYRGYQWPDPEPAGAPLVIGNCTHASWCSLASAAYFDRAVLASTSEGELTVVAVDSVSEAVVAGPTAVEHSGTVTGVDMRGVEMVAVPEQGFLAMCYETRPEPLAELASLMLRVIRPDGTPLGDEVTVASDLRNIGGYAIAWSGDEFVVVYWKAGSDSVGNEVLVQRVAPLI